MENNNIEHQSDERPVEKRRGKDKNHNPVLIAMSICLLACVLFSGFQSLYIFRLNSGLEGVFSQTRGFKSRKPDNQVSAIESIEESIANPTEALPEPWFSLEEAATVNKDRMSTVEIVKLVSPATVSISIISVDDGKETKISSGTGFIITEDGYIVTNQHVVDVADEAVSTYYVTVVLPDEDAAVRAEIVGSDAQTDIAVIKVNSDKKLPCVTMGNSDNLQAGELAIAIGNAMGTFDDTVTVGVISAPSREINRNGYHVDIIQTDTAVNPGNSGGPLINSFGEVIGIINAKIITSTSENIGFAIPVNSVKSVIESIINYGKVIGRPYIGVSLKYVASGSYYGEPGGVYVAALVTGGPSEKAGMILGDRVIAFDGVEISDPGDIIKLRDAHKVGDTVEVVVERDGKQITLPLVIGDSADY